MASPSHSCSLPLVQTHMVELTICKEKNRKGATQISVHSCRPLQPFRVPPRSPGAPPSPHSDFLGFCTSSYATPHFHAACTRLAEGAGALVLSADYRLAPEHRLPAAIEDAAAVLLWLRGQLASSFPGAAADTNPWLAEHADPSRVFVTGESAGGVLAHHLNVRFSCAPPAVLHPLRLRGFVPLMPFFTGVEPTPSELACPDGAYLNRDMSGRFVRLCLPAGATADHPFLNPFGPGAPALEGVAVAPTLVVVAGDDILRDRDVEFARRMREMGKLVEVVEFPGQGHAFFSLRTWSEPVDELIRVYKRFMDKACQS